MFVSRAKYEKLAALIEDMTRQMTHAHRQMEEVNKRAFLIGIERDGRALKITFARGGQVHQIEATACMSDNMAQWKKDLLE